MSRVACIVQPFKPEGIFHVMRTGMSKASLHCLFNFLILSLLISPFNTILSLIYDLILIEGSVWHFRIVTRLSARGNLEPENTEFGGGKICPPELLRVFSLMFTDNIGKCWIFSVIAII